MQGLYWYPSIGNKEYPYTDWKWKRKEQAWDTLLLLGEFYHQVCRLLRVRYKWQPDIVDRLDLNRLWRIKEETEIDFASGDDGDLE